MKTFKQILEERNVEHVRLSYSLMMRLFEYFREEETDDVILHDIAENISELDKKTNSGVLNMEHYDFIVTNNISKKSSNTY